jgi:hypothetical protein
MFSEFMPLSDDDKTVIYFSILLIIIWVIFFPMSFIWADDPFQKVILAPLGEEPLKLLLALMFILIEYKYLLKSPSRDLRFSDVFLYFFVIFSIIGGLFLGLYEGAIGNIFVHISTSSIGAILISFIYLKVRNKPWKIRYKTLMMFIPISVSMFIHSLSNQFLNIGYANSHPNFNYLVVIARFFVSNNFVNNDLLFSELLFIITILFIFIWYIYLYIQWKKSLLNKLLILDFFLRANP